MELFSVERYIMEEYTCRFISDPKIPCKIYAGADPKYRKTFCHGTQAPQCGEYGNLLRQRTGEIVERRVERAIQLELQPDDKFEMQSKPVDRSSERSIQSLIESIFQE